MLTSVIRSAETAIPRYAHITEDGWASITEIARRRGVSKVAISRQVSRFEAQGLISSRLGEGGTKLVSIEGFDDAVERYGSQVKRLAGYGNKPEAKLEERAPEAVASPIRPVAEARPAGRAPSGLQSTDEAPILALEQARKARADAALRELMLAERQGDVTPTVQVRDAAHAAVAGMKSALAAASVDASEDIAASFGIDPRLVRPKLRALEKRALAEFAAKLSEYATPSA